MNKNRLNIVSLMAAVAAGLIMVGCGETADNKATTVTGNVADSAKIVEVVDNIDYNGKTVYVQIDSLMRGYGMSIDLQDAFQKKSLKAQNELTAKGRNLEREARDFQEKAQKGLITRSQGQDIEAGLQKKQQAVMEYRDKMMAELTEEETVMMNQISETVMTYVKKYNVENKYSMIISTQGANPILIADPALNITDELLKGLNEEYKALAKDSKK